MPETMLTSNGYIVSWSAKGWVTVINGVYPDERRTMACPFKIRGVCGCAQGVIIYGDSASLMYYDTVSLEAVLYDTTHTDVIDHVLMTEDGAILSFTKRGEGRMTCYGEEDDTKRQFTHYNVNTKAILLGLCVVATVSSSGAVELWHRKNDTVRIVKPQFDIGLPRTMRKIDDQAFYILNALGSAYVFRITPETGIQIGTIALTHSNAVLGIVRLDASRFVVAFSSGALCTIRFSSKVVTLDSTFMTGHNISTIFPLSRNKVQVVTVGGHALVIDIEMQKVTRTINGSCPCEVHVVHSPAASYLVSPVPASSAPPLTNPLSVLSDAIST
jgi:hypothetical protein